MKTVALGELIRSAGRRAAEDVHHPVYSVTKHSGFVPSLDYFKKRVFSRELSGYKLVERGDFAYATIHLDEGSIGVAPESALISPMYTAFAIDERRVDESYLLHFLRSQQALSNYAQLGRGAVHRRKAISLASLSRLLVPLPELTKQQRIADILNMGSALLAQRRAQAATLAAARRAIWLDAFGRPSSWTERWPTGRLGELTRSVDYGTSEKSQESGALPVLRMGNISYEGDLDLTHLKYTMLTGAALDRYTVRRGDILFNRTNSPDLVGKTAVVNAEEPMAYAGYLIRVRLDTERALPEFVSGYLNSAHGKATLRAMAKSAVSQANINATELRAMRIPHPPLDVQQRYVKRLDTLTQHRTRLIEATRAQEVLGQALQARAFSGQL